MNADETKFNASMFVRIICYAHVQGDLKLNLNVVFSTFSYLKPKVYTPSFLPTTYFVIKGFDVFETLVQLVL